MRDGIKIFAEAMEKKMAEKDYHKGDSWKQCPEQVLRLGLSGEIDEWRQLKLHDPKNHNKEVVELVDIANFCMMLWNRLNNNAVGKTH